MTRRWRWALTPLLMVALSTVAAERPKVGVALSGGGAKGAAHVGVLRILEQHNIPVDYIAGTSMGAYVAALYSLGYTADEIETTMLSMDFNTGFSDDIPREALSYRDKQFRDAYPVELKMGYREGEMRFAKGALQGQTMSSLIRRSIGTVPEVPHFDQLPIPLRTVATDLTDRSEVVIDRGNLLEAMQASMTVPGALAPIEKDGRLLVDGGMVNNMPVSVVKAMGADVVIAVDIGAPLKGKEDLNSVFDVLDQLSGYLTNLSRDQQVALMEEGDILITPDIQGVGTSDFDQMAKLVPQGELAALAHIDALQALSTSAVDYQRYHLAKQLNRATWLGEQPPVVAVRLENQSWVKDDVIRDVLHVEAGDVLGEREIEAAIARIYSLDQFERVDAYLKETPEGPELVVATRGKNWGPNVFDLGLRLEDNLDNELDISLDAAYTANNLFNSGGQWRTELNIGTVGRIATEWYQPIDDLQRYYVIAMADAEQKEWNAFELVQEFPFIRIEQIRHSIATGGGVNLGRNAQLQLIYRYEDGKYHSVGSNEIGRLGDYWFHGPELSLGYDDQDQPMFPSEGQRWLAQVAYQTSGSRVTFDDTGWERDHFWVYQLEWSGATSWGAHNVIGKASFESISEDELTLAHFTAIGGFLNLSGFSKDSLFGSHKVLLGGIYTYDLSRELLGITWPMFLGASFEAGNVWLLRDDIKLDDLIYAGSVFISMETGIGPAALAFGHADTGDSSFYLFWGKQF
ncbi:patatin-like phospholipase family protein [Ferrimonas balearica]|uniref:patatin-like phospholipase family protein n=1 Tax=Ferrimonas balearica TaxID=44012 RepID=UPI001C998761|nr:patatin-like phospholipase family protein [Ferrimonas balearica]MBY5992385.1 patatin-like phospholipase family protein [Ferrimonas balearica]